MLCVWLVDRHGGVLDGLCFCEEDIRVSRVDFRLLRKENGLLTRPLQSHQGRLDLFIQRYKSFSFRGTDGLRGASSCFPRSLCRTGAQQ